ncbi:MULTISPECIES: endonuclease/exonuclease/phosphatase family protein [Nostocales]
MFTSLINIVPFSSDLVNSNNIIYGLENAIAQASDTVRIHDIQGASHTSKLVDETVTDVPGIVTLVLGSGSGRGFYIQDPNQDNDDATSEGIFVFLGNSSIPNPNIGQSVAVTGRVGEFRPGNNTSNLTTTQISANGTGGAVRVIDSLGKINPTIIGVEGRIPPNTAISDDFTAGDRGNVETEGDFEPASEGIDFYESLEGMLVQINNPVAISPTNEFGEIWVLPDNGSNATGRTIRGGSLISSKDFNPERIQIDDAPAISGKSPEVNVGATLGTITGIVDYNFNTYEVLPFSITVNAPSSLTKETTNLTPQGNNLTIATFNVENLDTKIEALDKVNAQQQSNVDDDLGSGKFTALADRIVNNLRSPDIISLEEIQDNTGAEINDGVVEADRTYEELINAIAVSGGPVYDYRQINPVEREDGGQPGGNIRVGFLFNPNRVQFVDRAGGGSTTNTTVNNINGQPELSVSPGRIDPTNPAFNDSRKSLVGEFIFQGQKLFVIANHWNSKGGDQPLYGPNQPPVLTTETQRRQQAQVINDFADKILAVDPKANIVVAGDLNDFEFSEPLNILKGKSGGSGKTVLRNLVETISANERYTYNFQGNAQVLDHILVSQNLFKKLKGYDVVHINSEFVAQDSDHDPSVAQFNLKVSS